MKEFFAKHKKAVKVALVLGAVIVLGLLISAGNDVLTPFNE